MSFLSGRSGSEKHLQGHMDELVWGADRYQASSSVAAPLAGGRAGSIGPARGAAGETQKMTCGNPACAGSWAKPWKNRRRPIFEGQWACSSRCLQALVRTAVRREAGDGIAADETPHRHRVPLGLVMLAKGWITQPQLRRALDGQKAAGGRIGEWLQQDCGVASETITRGLSMQWNCPVLTAEGFEPQSMALVMPKVFVEELGLSPLRIAASRLLYLAFEDRLDASSAFSLQKMSDLKIESGLMEGEALQSVRERLLSCKFVLSEREALRDSEQMISRVAELLEERQPVGTRLVRMGRYYWLRMWLENGTAGRAGTVPDNIEDMFDVVFRLGS